MDVSRINELEKIALEIRKDVVRMVGVAGSYGLRSALSIVDLLVYLYWDFMDIDHGKPAAADNDRFILSKGAAVPSLYACLARLGYYGREELWSYSRLGAMLQGYPDIKTPGIHAPGGTYGGGLGIGSGFAHAARMDGSRARVFCLLGDGELQEGVVWESLFAVPAAGLGNIVLVVELNDYQSTGPHAGLKVGGPVAEKIRSFGWNVEEVDGHDYSSMDAIFRSLDFSGPTPFAVLARTMNSGGIRTTEKDSSNSSEPLSKDSMDQYLSELESKMKV